MERRTVLRGLLTIAAASIVPYVGQAPDAPMIVGDGIHDDAAGINAAINGKPFLADGLVIRDQTYVKFGKGPFRMTAPMRFDTNKVVAEGAPFFTEIHTDHDGPCLILGDGVRGVEVCGFSFAGRARIGLLVEAPISLDKFAEGA